MAQYREGTITVTSNSATIVGTDTRWKSAGIEPGHWFTVRGQGITYTVGAVLSDTQLVLTGAYQGATQAGVYYILHTDFTPRGYAVPGPGDIDATIIVRRAIYDIDADMTAALGAPDGGARPIYIGDIVDLKSTTAITGQVITKLEDGSFGFVTPSSLSVTLANMGTAGTNVGQLYAGTNAAGAHQFRAIAVTGGTLTQNADRLSLTIPAPGEINTLASVGTVNSQSLVAGKSGTALQLYGVRGLNGVSVVRDGNDLVFSGTGTGGSQPTTGEANTAENIGAPTAATNVLRIFSDKLGVSLRLRSILFDLDQFTVTGENTGQYRVAVRRQRLSDSPDADLSGAIPGNIMRLESDSIWRAQPLPASGITSLSADPNPKLGGDLAVGGRKIVGLRSTISGMIEKPINKTYTVILRNASPIIIRSMLASCNAGSINFGLFIGRDLDNTNPNEPVTTPIFGTCSEASDGEATVPDSFLVPANARLTMLLVPSISPPAQDFSFSIATETA